MSKGVKDLQPRLVPLVPSLPLGEQIPRRRPLALRVLFQASEISIAVQYFNRLSQVQLCGEAKGTNKTGFLHLLLPLRTHLLLRLLILRRFFLFLYLLLLFNNMKRTHQVLSWNAMLTPCLANHARTDLKTSCHGCGHGFKAGYILSPRSQLWSIAKPREGSGSGTTFQSCQAKNLCCRKRVMGALFGIRLGDVSEAKVDGTVVVEIKLNHFHHDRKWTA